MAAWTMRGCNRLLRPAAAQCVATSPPVVLCVPLTACSCDDLQSQSWESWVDFNNHPSSHPVIVPLGPSRVVDQGLELESGGFANAGGLPDPDMLRGPGSRLSGAP